MELCTTRQRRGNDSWTEDGIANALHMGPDSTALILSIVIISETPYADASWWPHAAETLSGVDGAIMISTTTMSRLVDE